MLYIGLLSGTSMDAIDAALVDFSQPNKPRLHGSHTHPIPAKFKTECLSLSQQGQCSLDVLGYLDTTAGALFAEAVNALLSQTQMKPQDIVAIGSHGQNLRHSPHTRPPFTLQIGDPNVIAERTGITVVADFRRRDVAAGGQGAPLAPALHRVLFHDPQEDRIIINVGGISNLTVLSKEDTTPITGFDVGPGNALLDAWVHRHLGRAFDEHGQWGTEGQVLPVLLQSLLEDRYFKCPPPKSTGREYFNLQWLEAHLAGMSQPLAPEDVQATLMQLTVESIAAAVADSGLLKPAVFVCGGGVHNVALMACLQSALAIKTARVESTAALGIDPDWVEAILFAWLAHQTLGQQPNNCPSVTGALAPRILGGIYYR